MIVETGMFPVRAVSDGHVSFLGALNAESRMYVVSQGSLFVSLVVLVSDGPSDMVK